MEEFIQGLSRLELLKRGALGAAAIGVLTRCCEPAGPGLPCPRRSREASSNIP